MEDDELLERGKKRKKYRDFSKCAICQESSGKKQVTTLKLPQLYEPFEAIATFRAICSKFLAKHRHP